MHGPFDKSRCSFHVPEFKSKEEWRAWSGRISPTQRLEIMWLMNLARYGEEFMNRPMDRTRMQVLSMDEFNAQKEIEEADDRAWRQAHGWPPKFPVRSK